MGVVRYQIRKRSQGVTFGAPCSNLASLVRSPTRWRVRPPVERTTEAVRTASCGTAQGKTAEGRTRRVEGGETPAAAAAASGWCNPNSAWRFAIPSRFRQRLAQI